MHQLFLICVTHRCIFSSLGRIRGNGPPRRLLEGGGKIRCIVIAPSDTFGSAQSAARVPYFCESHSLVRPVTTPLSPRWPPAAAMVPLVGRERPPRAPLVEWKAR
jgi:hypothetical protein